MTTEHKLQAKRRTKLGTREARRLRKQGLVPGNVYGHKQDPVAIVCEREDIEALVRSRAHVVELELDGQVETTVLRETQWDTYGTEILHFDLLRVDPTERVTVEVPIELRGVAPGVLAGGILEQPLHSLEIECPAIRIPDSIVVRIGDLQIGDILHVRDVEPPPDSKVLNPPDAVVLHIVPPKRGEVEEAAEEEAAAEPEVVKKEEKAEDEREQKK